MRTTRRVMSLSVAAAASAAAFAVAGAVALASSAAQGVTTGVRPPGAGDASAIGAARPAASWRRAVEVPGLGALNKGGNAQVNSVSCGAAGSCAAGGYYTNRHHHSQGFVEVERHGRWGTAIEVPGLGALNKGGHAVVLSVSCASAGNCAAGGAYRDLRGHQQGFVVSQRRGRWGTAIEVPGLGALNKGGHAVVLSVSCASAGSCAAGGDYWVDRRGHVHGFVVSERRGRWGTAIEVPGLRALNKGGNAHVYSVSCASPGSCAAGGDYTDGGGNGQGFVVSEQSGVWGQAIEVPGLAALTMGGSAEVVSVSCGSPGYCAAVGDYSVDGFGDGHGFVAGERDGVWGKAIERPDLAALGDENAGVVSVSCASAGNCAAVGTPSPYGNGFAVSEKNGRWGKAIEVALGGRFAGLNAVSCGSPGNCAAVGFYSNDIGDIVRGLVVVERHGSWGDQIDVPGLRALDRRGDTVTSVSCPPVGGCAVVGTYTDSRGHSQGFVVSQNG